MDTSSKESDAALGGGKSFKIYCRISFKSFSAGFAALLLGCFLVTRFYLFSFDDFKSNLLFATDSIILSLRVLIIGNLSKIYCGFSF